MYYVWRRSRRKNIFLSSYFYFWGYIFLHCLLCPFSGFYIFWASKILIFMLMKMFFKSTCLNILKFGRLCLQTHTHACMHPCHHTFMHYCLFLYFFLFIYFFFMDMLAKHSQLLKKYNFFLFFFLTAIHDYN